MVDSLQSKNPRKKFNLTIEELSEILGSAKTDTIGLTEAEKKAKQIVSELAAEIEVLQNAYNEAYTAAYESITAQVGLWDKMDTSIVTSVEDIQKALQSQIRWIENYNNNLIKLSAREIEGVDALVKSLSDGSTESAAILSGLSIATDDEISAIIKSMERVEGGKDSLSQTMAEVVTDFDKKLSDLSDKTAGAINAMNNERAAQNAAVDTMRGYIDQTIAMIPELEKAYREAARAANQAYRDEMDMNSPSRKAMENSEDYWDGAILATENMKSKLEAAYSDAANASDRAARVSMPARTPQVDAVQIGDQVANAVSSVMGGQSSRTINLTITSVTELDGRQVGKAIKVYQTEIDSLAGDDLTEVKNV